MPTIVGGDLFGMEFCYFKEIFSSRFASKQLCELALIKMDFDLSYNLSIQGMLLLKTLI